MEISSQSGQDFSNKFRILLAFLPFAGISLERLATEADPVRLPATSRRSGRSTARLAAHFAGRAAIAAAFRRRGITAFIRANPKMGFLEVVDAAGKEIGGIFANVSHTAQVAVAAIATSPIGVDIESVHRDASKVLERVATDVGEKTALQAPDVDARLGGLPAGIALWSAKEAFSKATGLGLNFGLQHFVIPFVGTPPFEGATQLRGPLVVSQPSLHLERYRDYVVAVASSRACLEQGVERVELSL